MKKLLIATLLLFAATAFAKNLTVTKTLVDTETGKITAFTKGSKSVDVNSAVNDPTLMSKEAATKLGLYEYDCTTGGVKHANGNSCTVTGDFGGVNAKLFPYQTSSGTWYVRGRAVGQSGVTTARKYFAFSDVITPSAPRAQTFSAQPSYTSSCGDTCDIPVKGVVIGPSSSNFLANYDSGSWNVLYIQFDIVVDHKPNWAY